MAGFLSLFNGVVRLPLDEIGAPGFWIDVKKSLDTDDYADAQRALLGKMSMDSGGMKAEPDSVAYQRELVFVAIQAWNLTDENDVPLPLTPPNLKRESIATLPQAAFLEVYQHVNKSTQPRSTEDERSFRDGSAGSGGERGTSEAPDAAEVPH